MKSISFNKINIVLPIISFFLMILISYIMYSYWIPNFTDDPFSKIGIMGNDSAIYHTLAKEIQDILQKDISIKSDLFIYKYLKFPHTFINALLFLIYDSPFIINIFNAFILLISVFYITQIANILSTNKEKNLILSILFTSVCFFPSLIFTFNMNGKEPYIFLSLTIIIYNILFFNKVNLISYKSFFLNVNNIINIFFILLAIIFVTFIRSYLMDLIIISSLLTLSIILFINLLKKTKIQINILSIFVFIIIIFLLSFLFEMLFTIILESNTSLLINLQELSMDFLNTQDPFIWEYTKYIPNLLDKKINIISELRANFINFNINLNIYEAIKIEDLTISDRHFFADKAITDLNFCTIFQSNLILEKYIIPMNFIDFISYLPRLILLSVTTPNPEAWISSKSIFEVLASIEMLFAYIFMISIIINFKSLEFNDYFLLFLPLIIICFYFYVNPNLGTFIRYRSSFFIFIIFIGIYNWMIIILNIYTKIKKFFFHDNINKINNKFSILYLSNNILFLTSILTLFSFLIIIRDIFIINIFISDVSLDIIFLSFILLSFLGNTLAVPISDSLSYMRRSDNSNVKSQFIDLIKNNFLTTLLIIFLINLLLVFLNDYIISIFNLEKKLNFNIFLYISPIIILIPFNAYLSSYFYNINKTFIPYILQLLIPIFTIPVIYYNRSSFEIILILINFLSLLNTILLIIFSNIYDLNLKLILKKNFFSLTINKKYFKTLSILFLCQISVALIIMYTYGLISNYDSDNFVFFIFAFKLIIFFSSFFGAISSGILTPFLKINFNKNEKDMFFGLLLILYVLIFLLIILCFVFVIFLEPLLIIILNLEIDKVLFIKKTISLSFLLLPQLIYLNIIQKILILRKNFIFIIFSNLIGLIFFILLNYFLFSGELIVLIANLFISFSLISFSMLFFLKTKILVKLALILPLIIYFLFVAILIYSLSINSFTFFSLITLTFLIIFTIIYNRKENILQNEYRL